jgi:hypothetical protein
MWLGRTAGRGDTKFIEIAPFLLGCGVGREV